MKTITQLAILLVSVVSFAQDGQLDWATKIQTTAFDSYNFGTATDAAGNVYTCGTANTGMIITENYPYIAKHDKDGNLVWFRQFQGSGNSIGYGRSVALDSNGNVYVCGTFNYTMDFNPGTAVSNLTISADSPHNYMHDIYICKLNNQGNFVWAKRIGGAFSEECKYLAVDSDNNLILTGTFESAVDFDPGTGVHIMEGISTDMFVLKLNSQGNYVWSKNIGGNMNDTGGALCHDQDNNILISGSAGADIIFEDPSFNLTGSGHFLAKMNSSGNLLWTKKINKIKPSALVTDIQGNLFYTGTFTGLNTDFDPGAGVEVIAAGNVVANRGFISKLNPDGEYMWAREITGENSGIDIDVDVEGAVYACGYMYGTADFTPEDGGVPTYVDNVGIPEAFLVKISNNNEFQWVKRLKGISGQFPPRSYYKSMAIAPDKSVYCSGDLYGPSDFDPSDEGELIIDSNSPWQHTIFIQKFEGEEPEVGTESFTKNNISAYPVPVTQSITLEGSALVGSSIGIYNVLGEVVKPVLIANAERVTVDLGNLQSGTYFVKIVKGESVVIKKILVK